MIQLVAATDGRWESGCGLTMMFSADPTAISIVVDRVSQVLHEQDWPEAEVMDVELAFTEALANAIRHGCGGDINKRIRCSVGWDQSDEVIIVVRDPGSGFDPGAAPDPLDPANTFSPGGRGIFLMRALMDDVLFADGGREVQMRKRKARER